MKQLIFIIIFLQLNTLNMIFASARTFIRNRDYRYLLLTTLAVLLIGIFGFKYLENWNWLDSVNYAVSTMVTTGNSDVTPLTDGGKIFNIFYMFISVILILLFVNTIAEHFKDFRNNENLRSERHSKIVQKHVKTTMEKKN